MYALQDADPARPITLARAVSASADNSAELLVTWLNRLLLSQEIDGELYTRFEIHAISPHGLLGTANDYARFCQMLLNRGELDGKRILKPETVDLMFENQLKDINQRYGLGGMADGQGAYGWGGADGTQFWIDRKNNLYGVFMVQTQGYKAPTVNEFRRLANSAVDPTAKPPASQATTKDNP